MTEAALFVAGAAFGVWLILRVERLLMKSAADLTPESR